MIIILGVNFKSNHVIAPSFLNTSQSRDIQHFSYCTWRHLVLEILLLYYEKAVSFCYITICQNPMGLSKYYETIKFFLLSHPWAFKNLKNFMGEDFGICLSSHELSLPQNTCSRFTSRTEHILSEEVMKNRGCLVVEPSLRGSDGINSPALH